MLPEELLILGTYPWEIFYGCEGAKRLLQGDWKYWEQLALDVEQTALSRAAVPYTSLCGGRSDWTA